MPLEFGHRKGKMQDDLAQALVDGLKDAGIDFVTYLPETRLSQIVPLLREDPDIELIQTASEQEGVAIAVGATLGGKRAAVYMESTGIYVSAYSLLVTAKQLGVPLLLVVGHLGAKDDQRNSFLYSYIGEHTVPVLDALGIEHLIVRDGSRLAMSILDGVRTSTARRSPFALLFTGDFTE